MARIWAQRDRVALKDNPKYRGYVHYVNAAAYAGDGQTYSVQWDKEGCYVYLGDMLIAEREALELEKKEKENGK